MPGALEIRKPQSLHPADLAVSPPQPELSRGAPRVNGIERRLEVRLNHFHVVRMHQLHDLFDTRLILGKIENLLRARIPREHAVARIVLVRSELGYVESNLQTIFALAQPILCCLSPGGGRSFPMNASSCSDRAMMRCAASAITASQPGGSSFAATRRARAC